MPIDKHPADTYIFKMLDERFFYLIHIYIYIYIGQSLLSAPDRPFLNKRKRLARYL